MDKNLEIAIKASLEAGKRIMEIYEHEDFEVVLKNDDSPLTKADLASHEIIMQHLSATDIPVLSEEGRDLSYEERKHWSSLWIVDPIDGTKEFIKKNGEFTVNIALVRDQKPVMGVIYVPALKELYYAAENMGSFKVDDIVDFDGMENLESSAVKLPKKNLNKNSP